jgi:hypothetical protein
MQQNGVNNPKADWELKCGTVSQIIESTLLQNKEHTKKSNYDNNVKVMFTFDIHGAVYKTHALVFGC